MSEVMTVEEVAAVLKVSADTVLRRFAKVDGVIDLGSRNKSRRRYRVLRIPKVIVEKYLSTKAGHSIHITVPERPARVRKSDTWEARAAMNLAKAGLQNGCTDKKLYRRIADRARLLAAFVPEGEWHEISWSVDDENGD